MKNKIAIITGASSGIGKAIAHQLIEAGAIVVNADVHPPNHVAANNYYFIQTDLTLKEEVLHLFDEVAKLGVPHILICNAGKGVHEKLAEGDPEKWQSVININLMGTLRFLRAFLPSMVKKGNGDIIFISSVAANQAYAFGGIYAASKAAMDAIAATLRLELENNIRVSTIAPGVVDTAFFDNMQSGGLSVKTIGTGSLDPKEVADAVLFALNRNQGQVVSNITLRPTRQIF